jgi:hypothetical protein
MVKMSHTVPPLRSGIREEKVILTLPDRTEYLVTGHLSNTSAVYFFGGAQTYCVECQVHFLDSPYARFLNVHTADISRVYYDELCCLNRRLLRGNDTRKLLLLVISFIQNKYPHITGFQLSDASSRTCDNGIPVKLAMMHYLQDGRTWYMAHFGAEYVDKEDIRQLGAAEERLRSNKPAWGKIRSYIFTDLPLPEEEMTSLYESLDVLEFFRELNRRIGVSEFCSFISRWIDQFVRDHLKFTFDHIKFHITLADNPHVNPKVEYMEAPYQAGGKLRRQTRKRSRVPRHWQ